MASGAVRRRLCGLASGEKWSLGGGRRILWTPVFPRYLDRPGFWDPGTYLDIELGPLFTITILNAGMVVPLQAGRRKWQPDGLTTHFRGPGVELVECKRVTPTDAFESDLTLKNAGRAGRVLDVVLWGRIDAHENDAMRFEHVQVDRRAVRARCTARASGVGPHDVDVTWTLEAGGHRSPCTSFAVQPAEPAGETPDWHVSPFAELFDECLPDDGQWAGPSTEDCSVFIALHRRLHLRPNGTARLVAACRVTPRVARPTHIPDWEAFFAQAPTFRCSDPLFAKCFEHRWYALRLNAIDAGCEPLRHPCVLEGPGAALRQLTPLGATTVAQDLRWLRDPTLATGGLLNLLAMVQPDGALPIDAATPVQYADWGAAVRGVYEVHRERRFLTACYEPLARHAGYLRRTRDADETGLYDVRTPAETGKTPSSRYEFVASDAERPRVKAVDATIYVYNLLRTLAWMATELGKSMEAVAWDQQADATADAIRTKMWDPRQCKFCDVDPVAGRRSPVKTLTDFYPFLTDVAQRQHLPTLFDHLLNPAEFWTEWPAPTIALDDPTADACGRWGGRRRNRPWNGRVWLRTNSLSADALARAALDLDPRLEPYAAAFLTRTIHMLFMDGDVARPISVEHYNPRTGQPALFTGVEDHVGASLIDRIIRYVVGLRPQPDGTIVVEPLQFGLGRFVLENCHVAGQPVRVEWDGRWLRASVGRRRQSQRGGGRLTFEPT